FAFLETEDKKMVEKLLAMDPAGIKWKETVGPVSYEDTNSDLIRKAFTVPAGRMRVFKDGATYYLFYVKEDIALQIPPLDSVKEEIKVKLVDMKKEQFFKNWLKDMRSKADIKLNNEILKGIEFKNEQ
ncbi:MAG TPA: hypothetical protein PKG81_08475, partial [Candidatus Omnitrophota bacterium]|nr:hypothetical protein [Candidatus Omnitrophota bacterium]